MMKVLLYLYLESYQVVCDSFIDSDKGGGVGAVTVEMDGALWSGKLNY